jgi:hypothetical protein
VTSPLLRPIIVIALAVSSSAATAACVGQVLDDGSEGATPEPPGGGPPPDARPGDPPARADAGTDAATGEPGGPDAAPPGGPDAGPDDGLPPLEECATASIDRIQQWLASGEGQTVPATGTMLARDGQKNVARIQFVGAEWHVAVVWIGNQFEAQFDLTASRSFTLTYRATDDLWVQMRPGAHWSGGDKYVQRIPSTGGQLATRTFSFEASAWTTLPELGAPSYPYAEALRDVRGLVFVGETPNTIEFQGLRIDGFTPPCR